jgi:tetratricopeptide (TPR) repeat protein
VRRSIPAALPWFAIAGAWTLFTMGVQDITSEVRAVLTPGWMRPFVAGDALLFYARKLLVPEGLVPIYGHTPLLAAASPWFWFGLPAAIAVGFLALRRRNLYSLGFAFAVVFLLPVLGLLPFSYQRNSTVADRYLYCPMLGVGIAVAALLRAMQARGGRWARVSVAVVAVLLAAWAGISFRQSLFWRDSVTLWTRNIAVAPQASVPYTNLGAIYATRERYDETIRLSRLAVECDPLSHLAYANLGMGLLKAGDADGALAALGKSVALRADESLSQGLLGSALRMKGRNNEAQNAFETALRIDPRNLQAALGLAAIHVGGRRHAEAEQILRSAVKLRPDSPIALMNLGVVLVGAGRHADAVAPLREALRLDPANTEAREWLGRAEAGSGGSGSAK